MFDDGNRSNRMIALNIHTLKRQKLVNALSITTQAEL